jgi:hypothetical protein
MSGFSPTGCSVNHGEDVRVANNVHVNIMGTTVFLNGKGRRGGETWWWICFSARKTLVGSLSGIGRHAGPDKMGRNEATCGFDSRMAKGMDVVKNRLLEGKGNQGAENWGGDVTKEGKVICDGNGRDGDGRRFLEGNDGRSISH